MTSSHPEAKRSSLASSEKQRGNRSNLVMENSEQSSGEWSESDGELIIDTLSSASTAAVAPSRKEPPGKRRKEAGLRKEVGQGVRKEVGQGARKEAGPKKKLVEEAVDDGDGSCLFVCLCVHVAIDCAC